MNETRPLWAPWRIDFIRGAKESRCFLCGKKDDFSSPDEEMMVYRGDTAFVILNRFPYNSGHLLVAPYRHIGDIAALDEAEQGELMRLTIRAKQTLERLMQPQGYNIGFNLGQSAGAGVADHIHLHIVPRWNGDTNFMPVIGGTRVVPEALIQTVQMIRDHWR
ncbi:MAG: HIT domain-containing protein [Victivallales bacterium]|nr:HIT domain-containing protein [Victivallales bacterium]